MSQMLRTLLIYCILLWLAVLSNAGLAYADNLPEAPRRIITLEAQGKQGIKFCKPSVDLNCTPLDGETTAQIIKYYKGLNVIEEMVKQQLLLTNRIYQLNFSDNNKNFRIEFKVMLEDSSAKPSPSPATSPSPTTLSSAKPSPSPVTPSPSPSSDNKAQAHALQMIMKLLTNRDRVPADAEFNKAIEVLRKSYADSLAQNKVDNRFIKDLVDKRYKDFRFSSIFTFGTAFHRDTPLSNFYRGQSMQNFVNGSLYDLTLRQIASIAPDVIPRCTVHEALAYLTYEGKYINVYRKMEKTETVGFPPRNVVKIYYEIDCNKSWFKIYDQTPVEIVDLPLSKFKDRTDIAQSQGQVRSDGSNRLASVPAGDTNILGVITPETGNITIQIQTESADQVLQGTDISAALASGLALVPNPATAPMDIDVTLGTEEILVERKVIEQLNPFSLNTSNPQGQNKQEQCVPGKAKSCAHTEVHFVTNPQQTWVIFQSIDVADGFGSIGGTILNPPKKSGMAIAKVGDHVLRVYPTNCREAPIEQCDYVMTTRIVFYVPQMFRLEPNGSSFITPPLPYQVGVKQNDIVIGAMPVSF